MSRDIYTSLSGASAAWNQLNVVANNVANMSTDGYKAINNRFELISQSDHAMGNSQVRAAQDGPNMEDGSLRLDGNPTHFAIQGRGFFQIETPTGMQMQRSGRFQLNEERYLVTPQNEKVLGRSGPIWVPFGEDIRVSEDGTVFTQSGDEIDTLMIVDANQVSPTGGTRWETTGIVAEARGYTVMQGALETSNVDPMTSMIKLIEASRQFEIFQKALRTSDQMDAQVQKAGSV
jgi:flagellar basal body rod protein FlgG